MVDLNLMTGDRKKAPQGECFRLLDQLESVAQSGSSSGARVGCWGGDSSPRAPGKGREGKIRVCLCNLLTPGL